MSIQQSNIKIYARHKRCLSEQPTSIYCITWFIFPIRINLIYIIKVSLNFHVRKITARSFHPSNYYHKYRKNHIMRCNWLWYLFTQVTRSAMANQLRTLINTTERETLNIPMKWQKIIYHLINSNITILTKHFPEYVWVLIFQKQNKNQKIKGFEDGIIDKNIFC